MAAVKVAFRYNHFVICHYSASGTPTVSGIFYSWSFVLICVKATMKPGDPTYEIIGCAMRVHNELGPGLREKPYENALAVDFGEQNLDYRQQHNFPIMYHGKHVGFCTPDFTVKSEVVIDVKSIDEIRDSELAQMLNYLRISRIPLGLILNFKNSKLEWLRVVK